MSDATVHGELGRLALSRGDRSTAAQEISAAIASADGSGPESEQIASDLAMLGHIELQEGAPDLAITHFTRALGIRERLTDSTDPALVPDLRNLASAHIARGVLSDAEPLLARALGSAEAAFGEEHPDVTGLLNELASVRFRRGDNSGAEPLLVRLAGIKHRLRGDHPEVATVLAMLATVRERQGRHDDAEQIWRRVLDIRERTLAPNHFAIATSLEHLAEALAARGKLSEALPLLERALAVREQTLGTGHASMSIARNRIADIKLQQSHEMDDILGTISGTSTAATVTPSATVLQKFTNAPIPLSSLSLSPIPASSPGQSVPPARPAATTRATRAVRTAPRITATPLEKAALNGASEFRAAETIAATVEAQRTLAPEIVHLDDDAGPAETRNDGADGDASPSARPVPIIIPSAAGVMTISPELMALANEFRADEESEIDAESHDAVMSIFGQPRRTVIAGLGAVVAVTVILIAFAAVRGNGSETEFAELQPTIASGVRQQRVEPSDAGQPGMVLPGDDAASPATGLASEDNGAPARAVAERTPSPQTSRAAPRSDRSQDERAEPEGGEDVVIRPVNVASVDAVTSAIANRSGAIVDSALGATHSAQPVFTRAPARVVPSVTASGTASGRARIDSTPPSLLQSAPRGRYPRALRSTGMTGEVVIQLVVDATGAAEPGTLAIVSSNHELFSQSVRQLLPRLRFTAATVGGRPVSRLVEVAFTFPPERD
ncbi:MAG: TonB family protein [Gemmatimonadaceae bacterium]